MCDGFSEAMMAVGAASAVGSAAISGVSAAQQANASQAAANYNAEVAANNATIASEQRSAALRQGQLQVQQEQMQAARTLGSQRAALAANGVQLDSGSATDLLASTKFLADQDVNTIQSNAARQAWGYAVDQANYQGQSQLDAWQAKNSSPAGIGAMAGTASLLSSASMYAMGNKFNLNTSTSTGGE